MEVISKFGLAHLILSFCGKYSDESITLLTQLCKKTYSMCITNYHRNKAVTLKHRNQKYLKDPRLACYKLKILMNKNLSARDLSTFVSYYDNLVSNYQEQKKICNLNIYHPKKRKSNLEKVNTKSFRNCKFINLELIKQNPTKLLPLMYFADLFIKHEPNLLLLSHEKVDAVIEFAPISKNKRIRK